MYCLECCDAAEIPIPSNLRQTSVGDAPNDRAEWLAAKAAEKKAKFEAFLASRKTEAAPVNLPAAPAIHAASPYKTAAPTSAEQLRLI